MKLHEVTTEMTLHTMLLIVKTLENEIAEKHDNLKRSWDDPELVNFRLYCITTMQETYATYTDLMAQIGLDESEEVVNMMEAIKVLRPIEIMEVNE